MTHILIRCNATPPRTIWDLARTIWPHPPHLWPEISLGTILGCGSLSLDNERPRRDQPRREHLPQEHAPKGAMRLLQILVTESAYLIWVLRCERTIQERSHSIDEIHHRWFCSINARLTEDKITATKIKRDKRTTQKVKDTWEHVLRNQMDLPNDWITSREVLVGRRARRALPL